MRSTKASSLPVITIDCLSPNKWRFRSSNYLRFNASKDTIVMGGLQSNQHDLDDQPVGRQSEFRRANSLAFVALKGFVELFSVLKHQDSIREDRIARPQRMVGITYPIIGAVAARHLGFELSEAGPMFRYSGKVRLEAATETVQSKIAALAGNTGFGLSALQDRLGEVTDPGVVGQYYVDCCREDTLFIEDTRH